MRRGFIGRVGRLGAHIEVVQEPRPVRYVYLALPIVLTCALFMFSLQNLETVTDNCLSASLALPRSVLLVLTCVQGMFGGGALLSLLRGWVPGATTKPPARA